MAVLSRFKGITVPIKNKKMIRDMQSRAILNVDKEAYDAYKDRKATMQKLENYCNEFEKVRQEVADIKGLLLKYLEGKA